MNFKFCPECGVKLGSCPFGDDGFVPWCEACKHPYFEIFPVVAITLIVNEYGEVALIKQKYLSDKFYNFVSGYVTAGEKIEDCARREAIEEIGATLETLEFVQSKWEDEPKILLVGFIAHAKKTSLVLSCELDEALWVPARQALDMVYPAENIAHSLLGKYLQMTEAEHAD